MLTDQKTNSVYQLVMVERRRSTGTPQKLLGPSLTRVCQKHVVLLGVHGWATGLPQPKCPQEEIHMNRIETCRTVRDQTRQNIVIRSKKRRPDLEAMEDQDNGLRPDLSIVQKIQIAELEVVGWLLELAEFFTILALCSIPVIAVLGGIIVVVVADASRQQDRQYQEEQQKYKEQSQAKYEAFEQERQEMQALQVEYNTYHQQCSDLLWNAYGPPGRGYEFFVWFSKHFPDAKDWKENCRITPTVMVRRFIHDDDPTQPEELDEGGIETIRPEPELQPNALEGHPVFDPIKRQEEALRKLLTPEP